MRNLWCMRSKGSDIAVPVGMKWLIRIFYLVLFVLYSYSLSPQAQPHVVIRVPDA